MQRKYSSTFTISLRHIYKKDQRGSENDLKLFNIINLFIKCKDELTNTSGNYSMKQIHRCFIPVT